MTLWEVIFIKSTSKFFKHFWMLRASFVFSKDPLDTSIAAIYDYNNLLFDDISKAIIPNILNSSHYDNLISKNMYSAVLSNFKCLPKKLLSMISSE